MCGINGILSDSGLIDFESQIASMNKLLLHRGPDDQGMWLSDCGRVGFGHTRLSIIDTSKLGKQPMVSSSERFVITYNGEIYNFKELKKQYNIKCIGTSDTEVLLELIQKIGLQDTLKSIDGMFAFGLWDKKNQTLYLCRDRFGEKPIYYGWVKNQFVFSSQLDCLKLVPGWNDEISWEALNHYQHSGYIPSPLSIYADIKKLPPSCCLTISFSKNRFRDESISNYWKLPSIKRESKDNKQLEEYFYEFDYLIKDSVRSRMISDVPLGAFLSGGTDSSLIVATMQALSDERVNTFTIGINDKNYDEAPKAKLIASSLGTNHNEIYIDKKEIYDLAPSIYKTFDEPFSDSSQIPTYLIAKLAKKSVTVALSGDAGDEFYAGYKRYLTTRDLWFYLSKLPKHSKKYLALLLNNKRFKESIKDFSPEFLFKKYANSSSRLNKVDRLINLLKHENLPDFYSALNSNTNSVNFLNQNMGLISSSVSDENDELIIKLMKNDIQSYLPNDVLTKVDRASMAHSLEVRVPLLSKDLTEWSFNLPLKYKINKNKQKIFLNKYLERYLDKDLIYTEKKGFSVPMREWLKGPLKSWAEDMLNSEDFKNSEFWDSQKVIKSWKDHQEGLIDSSSLIWSVLSFQSWLKK